MDCTEYKIAGVEPVIIESKRVVKIKVSNKHRWIEVFFEDGESKLFDFEYFMEN